MSYIEHYKNRVAHTVEVTAATLYEAVALGLKQLQRNEWVEGIATGLNYKIPKSEYQLLKRQLVPVRSWSRFPHLSASKPTSSFYPQFQ